MFCMTQWPNTDLGVLRVKTDDPDNLHWNFMIEIKALPLTVLFSLKKKTVKVAHVVNLKLVFTD